MGRHCTLCNKTVLDFTDRSYAELLAAAKDKDMCAKVPSQWVTSQHRSSVLLKWAFRSVVIFTLVMSSIRLKAQSLKFKQASKVVMPNKPIEAHLVKTTFETIGLKGYVTGRMGKVPNAKISLLIDSVIVDFALTDDEGNYLLVVKRGKAPLAEGILVVETQEGSVHTQHILLPGTRSQVPVNVNIYETINCMRPISSMVGAISVPMRVEKFYDYNYLERLLR